MITTESSSYFVASLRVWAVATLAWGLILLILQPEHFFNSIKYSVSSHLYATEMKNEKIAQINQLVETLRLKLTQPPSSIEAGQQESFYDRVLRRAAIEKPRSSLFEEWSANQQYGYLLELASPGSTGVGSHDEIRVMIEKLERLKVNDGVWARKFSTVPAVYFETVKKWVQPSLIGLVILTSFALLKVNLLGGSLRIYKGVFATISGTPNTTKLIALTLVACALCISISAVVVDYHSPVKSCVRSYIRLEAGHPDEVVVQAVRSCSQVSPRTSGGNAEGNAASDIDDGFFGRLERLFLLFTK